MYLLRQLRLPLHQPKLPHLPVQPRLRRVTMPLLLPNLSLRRRRPPHRQLKRLQPPSRLRLPLPNLPSKLLWHLPSSLRRPCPSQLPSPPR
jgi:hypothetical protein